MMIPTFRTVVAFLSQLSQGNRSSSESTPLRPVASAASGQEGHSDDHPTDTNASPPPLGVKLSVYRLLNLTIFFTFGITKGIQNYKGKSTSLTTLEWVGGTLVGGVLLIIGWYDGSKKLEWLFQVDLAPAIGYCTKCVVAGFMWPLFYHDGLFVFILSLGSLLVILAWYPFDYYFSNVHHLYSLVLGLSFGTMIYGCMVLLWFSTRKIRRVWAWPQRAMGFVDEYGPAALLTNQYGWFGVAGTIAGFFCGITLVALPYAVFSIYFE